MTNGCKNFFNILIERGAILFALLLALSLTTTGYGQLPSEYIHVLVLNSYHPEYKWTADTLLGIKQTLRAGSDSIHLSIEYMDTKRISGDAYFRKLAEIYAIKYSRSRFNVIICTDNDALRFMQKWRNTLFGEVPVVFCGINDYTADDTKGLTAATGINEAQDISSTIDAALKLHPGTHEILVLNDDTTTGKRIRNIIDTTVFSRVGMPRIRYLTGSLKSVLQQASMAPADSMILYTIYSKDRNGTFYEYDEVMQRLRTSCDVPVFGIWDFYLGLGMEGGMLTNGYDQGKKAAELTLRILKGEKAESIPVIMESTNRYMFDYRELKRFGVDISRVPRGSIIINRPPGVYDYFLIHRTFLLGLSFITLFILLSLLSLGIARERINRRRISETEMLLRSIINAITESVLLLQSDGRIIEANNEGRKRLNIPADPGIDANIKDYLPEEVVMNRKNYIRQVVEKGESVQFMDERFGKTILTSMYPIMDKKGIVTRIAAYGYDVTVLRHEEELLNNIFSSSPIGILFLGSDGSMSMANPMARKILFMPEDMDTGSDWWVRCTGLDPHSEGKPVAEVLKNGNEIHDMEISFTDQSGTNRFISVNAAPVKNFRGNPEGAVLMILDITEKKYIEEELKTSRSKIAGILESINDGFFSLDKNRCFTYVNARAEELLDIMASRVLGKPVDDVFRRDEFQPVYIQFETASREQKSTHLDFYAENLRRWFSLSLYPFSEGFSIYFTDITQRKHLEMKLQEYADTDMLTGILNRRAGLYILEKSIYAARRERTSLTICYIDVNGLKKVNDIYGHTEGDRLIITVSAAVRDSLRESDTLCRLGGDEFLIILPKCDLDEAGQVKKRIIHQFDTINGKGEYPYGISVSFGLAVYPADSTPDIDEFISQADREMYKEKTGNR